MIYIETATNEKKEIEKVIHCSVPNFILIKDVMLTNLDVMILESEDKMIKLLDFNEKVTKQPTKFSRITKLFADLKIQNKQHLDREIEIACQLLQILSNLQSTFQHGISI